MNCDTLPPWLYQHPSPSAITIIPTIDCQRRIVSDASSEPEASSRPALRSPDGASSLEHPEGEPPTRKGQILGLPLATGSYKTIYRLV
jgi:hypothetical protein